MKERPILFSGAMVRAILAGQKTQTRRVVKPPPAADKNFHGWVIDSTCSKDVGKATWAIGDGPFLQQVDRVRCPYGQPGDRLWLRETWAYGVHALAAARDEDGPFVYAAADGTMQGRLCDRWRPSIHMPRAACRIQLEVTAVRVERLNDISEADCWAEGIEEVMHDFDDVKQCEMASRLGMCIDDGKPLFVQLWEAINGDRSWDANPWVWVVEFKRVEQGTA